MITKGSQPAVNPANLASLPGVFREVLSKFLQNVDDMLPAMVIEYDRAAKRATVQPLVMVITTNDELIPRAQIASVPVLQLGGGGFVLDFNLKPGDLGFIKANDRDISLFLQSYSQNKPNTLRKHSFEDGIFIPAPMTGYSINDEDAENCVLQTLDGTQRVSIWADKIKVTSNNRIILDAPITECTGALITGTNEDYDQEATINGTIRATVDVIADPGNISLKDHVHINSGGTGDGGTPKTS